LKNQTSDKGGRSPKIRGKVNPASKKVGGMGRAADASTGKSTVPAGVVSQSGTQDSPVVPHGVKIGHF
jgi:hypothetical protein